jgi:light-regulated signal transduction histidine kinase (bacteriophytochrome)
MRVPDCHVDPSFAGKPPAGDPSIRSLLAVPVNAHTGESFGTLVFGHPMPGRFGPREEQLAVGIAAQAAVALDNARLFEEALRVQQALHKANLSLRSANTDLEQFAFAAAHDLREPLRMVTTYTQLLERRVAPELSEQARGFMRQIVDGATRMSDLLQDLLSYTNTATQSEPAGAVDLQQIVSKVIQNLSTAIAEAGAEVQVGPLPVISGRRAQMILVFQNLIGNAIKYRRPDVRPVVEVSGGRNDAGWLIRVRDNGIGIPPQYQLQIFGVFKRLHGRDIPGTGIGLAICQRAIERAGGKIWVESTPGEGSTFLFTLPARDEYEKKPTEPRPEEA